MAWAADWPTAIPESQGVDSAALASVIDEVMQKHLGTHSLLVIRHGHVVVDAYFYPYNASVPHDVASVTKTMTSVLTGIAVGQEILKLDTPVVSIFPREAPASVEEVKRKITVRDLLHMESGLECGYAPGEVELEQMKRSPNWVAFTLALPMKYSPGTHSAYCSPGYHLLGSAIGAAAKMTEAEFARKNLFEPLGIRDVVWPDDPQGRTHGWGDSHFYPQDLAKIGYLYEHGGEWRGKQIVPREWVEMSTTPARAARGEPGGLGVEWNVVNGLNGRQYGGTGRGGQSLIVWPELDTIVVMTAGGNGGQLLPSIRAAVKGDGALAENAAGVAALRAKVAEAAKAPEPQAVAELPAMARSISGVVWEFPVNPSRLDSIALTFAGGSQARVEFTYVGQKLTMPVGLDGVYRLGPNGPLHLPAGARGQWISEKEFQLDLNFVSNINHYSLKMAFEGEKVNVTASEASGLIRNGQIVGTRKR